jgi:hypothetical protein
LSERHRRSRLGRNRVDVLERLLDAALAHRDAARQRQREDLTHQAFEQGPGFRDAAYDTHRRAGQ